MQFLPVRVQNDDLLVSLLAKSLPFDNLFILLHHRLLRHPVFLGYQPILVCNLLNDPLESALVIISLVFSRTRQGVYTGLQILYLRLKDLVLCGEFVILLNLISLQV